MNAQRLRANAQQMATNRLHSNSAGNANPSTGMYLELAGSKFPENAAIIVTRANTMLRRTGMLRNKLLISDFPMLLLSYGLQVTKLRVTSAFRCDSAATRSP